MSVASSSPKRRVSTVKFYTTLKKLLLVFTDLMIYLSSGLFIYPRALKDTWVYFITPCCLFSRWLLCVYLSYNAALLHIFIHSVLNCYVMSALMTGRIVWCGVVCEITNRCHQSLCCLCVYTFSFCLLYLSRDVCEQINHIQKYLAYLLILKLLLCR